MTLRLRDGRGKSFPAAGAGGGVGYLTCRFTGSGEFLFQAVGAAIIGGVALTGGKGSIYGTLVGAAILGVLNAGLVLSGVNPGLTLILTGALIVLAGLLQSGVQRLLAQIFRYARSRASRN